MVHINRVATTKEVSDEKSKFESAPESKINLHPDDDADDYTATVYGSRYAEEDLPRHEMPDKEMPPAVAYRLIKDDLTLDGTPTLNLASFVTTVHDALSPGPRHAVRKKEPTPNGLAHTNTTKLVSDAVLSLGTV